MVVPQLPAMVGSMCHVNRGSSSLNWFMQALAHGRLVLGTVWAAGHHSPTGVARRVHSDLDEKASNGLRNQNGVDDGIRRPETKTGGKRSKIRKEPIASSRGPQNYEKERFSHTQTMSFARENQVFVGLWGPGCYYSDGLYLVASCS